MEVGDVYLTNREKLLVVYTVERDVDVFEDAAQVFLHLSAENSEGNESHTDSSL